MDNFFIPISSQNVRCPSDGFISPSTAFPFGFPRSAAENRRLNDDSKFRQLPCRTFISSGTCPYRERCVYLHDPRIMAKDARSKTRRKNKEDIILDSLFWPVMSPRETCRRLDTSRQPHVVQEYNVPHPQQDRYRRHDQAVFSLWMHFVELCSKMYAQERQANFSRAAIQSATSMNESNEVVKLINNYTQEERLFVFIELSLGRQVTADPYAVPTRATFYSNLKDIENAVNSTEVLYTSSGATLGTARWGDQRNPCNSQLTDRQSRCPLKVTVSNYNENVAPMTPRRVVTDHQHQHYQCNPHSPHHSHPQNGNSLFPTPRSLPPSPQHPQPAAPGVHLSPQYACGRAQAWENVQAPNGSLSPRNELTCHQWDNGWAHSVPCLQPQETLLNHRSSDQHPSISMETNFNEWLAQGAHPVTPKSSQGERSDGIFASPYRDPGPGLGPSLRPARHSSFCGEQPPHSVKTQAGHSLVTTGTSSWVLQQERARVPATTPEPYRRHNAEFLETGKASPRTVARSCSSSPSGFIPFPSCIKSAVDFRSAAVDVEPMHHALLSDAPGFTQNAPLKSLHRFPDLSGLRGHKEKPIDGLSFPDLPGLRGHKEKPIDGLSEGSRSEECVQQQDTWSNLDDFDASYWGDSHIPKLCCPFSRDNQEEALVNGDYDDYAALHSLDSYLPPSFTIMGNDPFPSVDEVWKSVPTKFHRSKSNLDHFCPSIQSIWH